MFRNRTRPFIYFYIYIVVFINFLINLFLSLTKQMNTLCPLKVSQNHSNNVYDDVLDKEEDLTHL